MLANFFGRKCFAEADVPTLDAVADEHLLAAGARPGSGDG